MSTHTSPLKQLALHQANALAAGGCWLRDLSLADNNLLEFPAFPNCPLLLRLDLRCVAPLAVVVARPPQLLHDQRQLTQSHARAGFYIENHDI